MAGRWAQVRWALCCWVALASAFAVQRSAQSDEICELPGMTMEYPNVKVQGTYRMKQLLRGPSSAEEGFCSVYCKEDKNLYFKDDDGREKALTANELSTPVNIKGSHGEMLKVSRSAASMASYITLNDAEGKAFESKIGHESAKGTGVFGGGQKYALSIGTATDHAVSFHTGGKASPRLLISGAGKVGIGRVPKTNALELNGDASKTTAGSWLSNSDARIKEAVETIPTGEALSKILALRPVSYRYVDAYARQHPEVARRERWVNFIAQEYAQVFPDAVWATQDRLTTGGRSAEGNVEGNVEGGEEEKVLAEDILQVDVHDVGIHVVAALQEQQKQIEALQAKVDQLLQDK